jgi:hypothetical protein
MIMMVNTDTESVPVGVHTSQQAIHATNRVSRTYIKQT